MIRKVFRVRFVARHICSFTIIYSDWYLKIYFLYQISHLLPSWYCARQNWEFIQLGWIVQPKPAATWAGHLKSSYKQSRNIHIVLHIKGWTTWPGYALRTQALFVARLVNGKCSWKTQKVWRKMCNYFLATLRSLSRLSAFLYTFIFKLLSGSVSFTCFCFFLLQKLLPKMHKDFALSQSTTR